MDYDPVAVFSALADPLRLRCLALLAIHRELCVCEFVAALDIRQPTASKHLAALRSAGLLTMRRDAQWTLYALADGLPDWVQGAMTASVASQANTAAHQRDHDRLAAFVGRPQRLCAS